MGAWLAGGRLTAPAQRSVGRVPQGFGGRTVSFASDSGTRVTGWWLESGRSAPRGTAILLHPLRGDRRAMLGRAELLLAAGFDCLAVDLYAHGETQGERIALGWRARHDVRAAVAFADRAEPNRPLVVLGRSLGGASALLAGPLGIDALVVESVYPDVAKAVRNRIGMRLGPLAPVLAPLLLAQLPARLGCSAGDLAPADHVATAGCPVLVLGGAEDRRTTREETGALFERASEPKALVLFAGAAHVDLQA
ncbi:MAG: alpha/beta fold hydrolase, partial [Planctomycetota bacterium]